MLLIQQPCRCAVLPSPAQLRPALCAAQVACTQLLLLLLTARMHCLCSSSIMAHNTSQAGAGDFPWGWPPCLRASCALAPSCCPRVPPTSLSSELGPHAAACLVRVVSNECDLVAVGAPSDPRTSPLPPPWRHPACRGRWAEGKAVLRLLRGTAEVDAEYADIADAAQQAAKVSLMQVSAGVCASV